MGECTQSYCVLFVYMLFSLVTFKSNPYLRKQPSYKYPRCTEVDNFSLPIPIALTISKTTVSFLVGETIEYRIIEREKIMRDYNQ